MKITKQNLLSVLEFPTTIIKRRALLPACGCYHIQAKAGVLTVKASDGDQFIEQTIACIGTIAAFCVPAKSIQSIIGFFSESVELEIKDGILKIDSGGKFSAHTIPADEFPQFDTKGMAALRIGAIDLADGIARVSFASSDEPARPERNGVHIKCDGKAMVADAFNGVRYARVQKPLAKVECEFFVPLAFAASLRESLRRTEAKVEASTNMIVVKFDNKTIAGSYACKLAEVKFPSVQSYLDAKKEELGEINPCIWLPMFRGALAMSGDDDKVCCKTSVSAGKFEHTGKSGDISLKLPDKVEKCDLNLNASTFIACLEAFGIQKAKLSTGDNGAVFIISGDLTVVTSQLRGA